MSTKPWPVVPGPPKLPWDVDGYYVDVELRAPEATACKHGRDQCERCGTSDRRDGRHATVGGKGLVARIPRGK